MAAVQRKSNIMAVLAAAYSSALFIEYSGLSIQYIFWFYCLLYFSLIVYCYDKCKVLQGYAVLNFVMICACVPLIVADYPLIILILWDANLSLADIMLSYEIAMLICGGWRAAMAYYNRGVDADSWGCTNRTDTYKGFAA